MQLLIQVLCPAMDQLAKVSSVLLYDHVLWYKNSHILTMALSLMGKVQLEKRGL